MKICSQKQLFSLPVKSNCGKPITSMCTFWIRSGTIPFSARIRSRGTRCTLEKKYLEPQRTTGLLRFKYHPLLCWNPRVPLLVTKEKNACTSTLACFQGDRWPHLSSPSLRLCRTDMVLRPPVPETSAVPSPSPGLRVERVLNISRYRFAAFFCKYDLLAERKCRHLLIPQVKAC